VAPKLFIRCAHTRGVFAIQATIRQFLLVAAILVCSSSLLCFPELKC
jgi:hypothetical protein